ncbi:MAG: metallophosphoesterase, partial [Cyanobacteria bacterium]|nr:metallophosphoesterase [Cyanobacteriota bacterium]
SKIPAYLILGNHDVGVVPKQSKKDTLKHIKRKTRLGFNIPNKGYYSFTPHPSVLFIALDGTTDQKVTSNGFLPDEQLTWLKNQLESNPSKLVFISLHFPPVEPSHSRNHQIVEPDLTKFMEILESHPNVTAVFTGHYHAARITQQKGIVYFAAPALVEYPNAFRVFTLYANGKIKAEWVPTRLKEIQKDSFSRSAWPQAALGNPEKDHSFFGSLRFVPNSAANK